MKNELGLEDLAGLYPFEAKGKRYRVVVMPLAYAAEFVPEGGSLILPQDGDYGRVLYNFAGPDGTALLEKWTPRLLEYEGRPAALGLLMEHGWDIVDLGRFLRKALAVSG